MYYSYTLMYLLVFQHCCYSIVCHIVRSLMACVCQEIKELLTYLLTYLSLLDVMRHRSMVLKGLDMYTVKPCSERPTRLNSTRLN